MKTVLYPIFWVWNRANEGSTWASIAAAAGTVSIALDSGTGLIAALGAAAMGVVLKDKINKVK